MKWEPKRTKRKRYEDRWELWYAWHPVKMTGFRSWHWMEFVWRKDTVCGWYGSNYTDYKEVEYRI
jgi:hypothetical protein